jgi:ring-1,2-phenylacetyl-CoA epoxidase subunit PaaD
MVTAPVPGKAVPGDTVASDIVASGTAPSGTRAYDVAAGTPDPELPMLTVADLGILRAVDVSADGVLVTITPTYSGCPAMREIGADVRRRLERAGFERVTVRTQLAPAWTSDWITSDGRRKLAAAGLAPPPAAAGRGGPVPLTLTSAPPESPGCPRCGSPRTRQTARFSATACKSLHRCEACGEPFETVKAL